MIPIFLCQTFCDGVQILSFPFIVVEYSGFYIQTL